MQPEIVEAIQKLHASGILPDPPASRLLRTARRELVSVRLELRLLLYLGVALVTTGFGLLVKDHYRQIGPFGTLGLLSFATAACLVYVLRHALPFSWNKIESANLAFDYVLLLGVLLLGSDLAYAETQFALLGEGWRHHLLLLSLLYLAFAYRFDSTTVLALSLTSFAAWLGLSTRRPLDMLFDDSTNSLRLLALVCGVLYLATAIWAVRRNKKPHFEAVWANLGLMLLFGGILSGALRPGARWFFWSATLFVVAAGVATVALKLRRSTYFAQALIAAEIATVAMFGRLFASAILSQLLVVISSIVVLAVIVKAHRYMKGPL